MRLLPLRERREDIPLLSRHWLRRRARQSPDTAVILVYRALVIGSGGHGATVRPMLRQVPPAAERLASLVN